MQPYTQLHLQSIWKANFAPLLARLPDRSRPVRSGGAAACRCAASCDPRRPPVNCIPYSCLWQLGIKPRDSLSKPCHLLSLSTASWRCVGAPQPDSRKPAPDLSCSDGVQGTCRACAQRAQHPEPHVSRGARGIRALGGDRRLGRPSSRAAGLAGCRRRRRLPAPARAAASPPSRAACPASCQVGKDKLSVRYNGPAQHDNDVGSIQVGAAAPMAGACSNIAPPAVPPRVARPSRLGRWRSRQPCACAATAVGNSALDMRRQPAPQCTATACPVG